MGDGWRTFEGRCKQIVFDRGIKINQIVQPIRRKIWLILCRAGYPGGELNTERVKLFL